MFSVPFWNIASCYRFICALSSFIISNILIKVLTFPCASSIVFLQVPLACLFGGLSRMFADHLQIPGDLWPSLHIQVVGFTAVWVERRSLFAGGQPHGGMNLFLSLWGFSAFQKEDPASYLAADVLEKDILPFSFVSDSLLSTEPWSLSLKPSNLVPRPSPRDE